jgi:Pro-kumamolisin, activation domain/Putative Ig domain/Bacterial Ig-like domain (group 3)
VEPGRAKAGQKARLAKAGLAKAARRRGAYVAILAPALAVAVLAMSGGVIGAAPASIAAARAPSRTASAGAAAAVPGQTGAHRGPERVGSVPAMVRGAHRIGALAGSAKISVDVMLAPRSAAALQAYAMDVSSPGNSLYRRYLTVGQFAARFGPTASAVSAVESAIRAAGLRPGLLASDHLMLPVTATAGQFATAFSTGFERYHLPGGRVAFANTRAPVLPAAAAPYVQAVVGLDNLTPPQPVGLAGPAGLAEATESPSTESPQVVTGGPQPCEAATDDAPGNYAYTADQVASAYNFSALYGAGDEGAGVTVAVLELEPNLNTDITAYQSCYRTNARVSYTEVDGGPTGSVPGSDDTGLETDLDIEDIIGLAPKAAIDVYQAPNSGAGLIDDYTAIVDDTSVHVASTSWGLCESQAASIISAEGTLFEQAATEGQSWFASAGDSGSTNCGTSSLAVDDPASQPYVTGVGGTSLTSITGSAQTVWNDSSAGAGAGGGGISAYQAMPAYQSSAPASLNVINAHSSGSPCGAASGTYCREVPDVSASADPYHGYLVYYDGAWTGVGGTSGAAPTWAALIALTDASAACDGTPIGFANPVLYKAAAENYSANFSDITTGDNDYAPDGYGGGLYPAGTGYDMASGLGTPKGGSLPQALCGRPTVTVISPGNRTLTFGVKASLQVAATDPGRASLTFSASGLPAGLSISSTGLISGTPRTAGTYRVTVKATDSTGTSGSTAFTVTVRPAKTSTSLTLSKSKVSYGDEQAGHLTVKVRAASGTPSGTVTVKAGTKALCTIRLKSGEGTCALAAKKLEPANYTLVASYPGNADFIASTSAQRALKVVK